MFNVNPSLGVNSLNSYKWELSGGLTQVNKSPDGSSIFVKVLNPAIDQSISVIIGSNCNPQNKVTKALKASVPPPAFSSASYCIGQNIGVQATYSVTNNAQNTYSYRWLLPDNWVAISSNGQDSSTVTVQFNNSSPGNITIVGAQEGCGTSISAIRINRYPSAALPITGPPCVPFGNNSTLTYSVQGGENTYLWEVAPTSSGWKVVGGTGPSVQVIPAFTNIPAVGEVMVRATIQGNCGSAPVTSTFAVKIGPDKPDVINGQSCVPYGSSPLTYSISPVLRATGYQWKVPSTWTVVGNSNSNSLTVNPNNTNGVLKVVATACGTASDTSQINIVIGPNMPGSIFGSSCIAYGSSSHEYNIIPVANARGYQWQIPDGWSFTLNSNQQGIIVTSTNNIGGNIKVRTLGCSSSTNSNYRELTISVGPPQPDNFINPVICVQSSGQSITYSINPVMNASGYSWSLPAGWSSIGPINQPSINVVSGNNGGMLSVKALGCNIASQSPPREIAVAVGPDQPGPISYYVDNIHGNTCIYRGGNRNITFSIPQAVAGAESYTWTFPNEWGVAPITSTSLSTTVTTDFNSGGVITVTANRANGCQGIAQTINVVRGGIDLCVEVLAISTNFRVHVVTINGEEDADLYCRWLNTSTGELIGTSFEGQGLTAVSINKNIPNITLEVIDANGCKTSYSYSNIPDQTYCNASATASANRNIFDTSNLRTSVASSNNETNSLTLSPNPASNELKVELPIDLSSAFAQIYSMEGSSVDRKKISSSNFTLDTRRYKNGAYYIIVYNSKMVLYDKFIVKH